MKNDLPTNKKFSTIYADPPWNFKTHSEKGLVGRPQHYDRMSLDDIRKLPINDCAAKDCWLFMWTTSPHLEKSFEVMRSWGFKYSSVAFTWVKLNPKAASLFILKSDLHTGQGYTTRKNAEFCLLGRKGQPKRLRKDIHEIIISPRREHSRKPEEAYTRIEQFAPGPFLELFGRNTRKGWETWGNETEKFNQKREG